MRDFDRMSKVVLVGIAVISCMTLAAVVAVVWAILNPETIAGRLGSAVKAFLEAAQ